MCIRDSDETIQIITTPQRKRDSGGYYMPVPTPDDYGMTIIE